MKLCLVTSAGGHFFQLYLLEEIWRKHNRFWVTFNKPDVVSLIPKEKKWYAHYPESRHLINTIRNFFLAIKILSQEKPSHMISIGAGIAVPFFLVARVYRIKTIYIEPLDFIKEPSLTGYLIYHLHLADLFLIQNTFQQAFYPQAKFWGSTL